VKRLAMSRRLRLSAGLVALVLALLRLSPHDSLRAGLPLSTDVWSADGELLRLTRATDDQYRVWVPLAAMSPVMADAFLLKEDRWFYWHLGVNPVSLVRAAARTYSGGVRQGGSTVTMQLARLRGGLRTRTPGGKARQLLTALWLELRHSKREILETYLNSVPLGGNVQGVGAASHIYFEKAPDRLTLAEALTLAVIPQQPARRVGRPGSEANVRAARDGLAQAWARRYRSSEEERRQMALAVPVAARAAMPMVAPHFAEAVLATTTRPGRVDTTLDASLQRLVERQLQRYLAQYGWRGIRNASALVVDSRDMAVRAWVGSADFWNVDIDGQVNGVTAKRSPGSTLKPFVYALALDQGVLHPRTILRDAPSSFGPFTPENFDGRFYGPIPAEEALVRSRNVPAVWVALQLEQPSLYQFLQSAGVRDLQPESFYGLALPLGGGEMTMEELVGLYAMLANGGLLRPLRVRSAQPPTPGVRVLSPEAAFVTLDMLRHNPRPDGDGASTPRSQWPVAWKTGTSWGFRDAWAVGAAGPYVVAVWIGDFRGEGNPAFVGTDAAAPLFFRITDALNLARADEQGWWVTPPPGATRLAVCAESGDLPNADCPRTVETWYIPGKSPMRVSQLHRKVGVDPSTGQAMCPPYGAGVQLATYEYWSSDMLKLFRQAGMPRRTPPESPDCAAHDVGEAPRIASPLRNVAYTLRSGRTSERIPLEASAAGDARTLYWFDGKALIGSRPVSDGPLAWRPTEPGLRVVRVVDDRGRTAERDVDVQFLR
jgi:penicillin-binding protein 1C